MSAKRPKNYVVQPPKCDNCGHSVTLHAIRAGKEGRQCDECNCTNFTGGV